MEEAMTKPLPEPANSHEPPATAFLRLLVRNHAGVMSHVCGLFARRSFNLDGIVCLPVGDRTRSAILLAVNDDERLDQLIRQLRKLEDVIEVMRAQEAVQAFEAARPWLR
jgi:acetolactate synthase-1/3 small subunit